MLPNSGNRNSAGHSPTFRSCRPVPQDMRGRTAFFDRVTLHYTGIAPGNVQGPASVVANLADARLSLRNRPAVTTGKTTDPVPVKSLVKFALADVLVNEIPQRRHIAEPKCRSDAAFRRIPAPSDS